MKICSNCGMQLDDTTVFCTGCGTQQPEAPQQPQYAAPQQPQYAAPQQPQYAAPQQPQYAAPQQPVYGAPQPAFQAPTVPGKGLGIAGMVLGIIAIVMGFCFYYVALPCAVIGLILSGVALSKAKAANMKNGMAIAGLVCSIISLVPTIFSIFVGAALMSELGAFCISVL